MKKKMLKIMTVGDLIHSVVIHRGIREADKKGRDIMADLTGRQIHVVMNIAKIEPCCLTAAAEKLRVSKASASVMVDTLVNKGMLVREVDANDRRRVLIATADKVKESIKEVDEEILKHFMMLAEKMDSEVVDRWYGVMKEIGEVLAGMERERDEGSEYGGGHKKKKNE